MPTRRKIHRAFIASALSCVMVVGGTAIALAAQANVDGGTWSYGVNDTHVYSNYYHPTCKHGSTAEGTFTARSGCVGPGQTSYASAPKKWRGNQSYYSFC